MGAKVNGRMVPLRHKLHSGDIVEIITQPAHKPSRDWLGVVRSSRARNKIKHWLNIHQRERAIEIGKKLVDKEARKYRISLKDIKDGDWLRVALEYGLGQADGLMAALGYGKYSARQVLGKLAPAAEAESPATGVEDESAIGSVVRRVFGGDHSSAIRVKGQGENIIGYVTRGKGVAVHSIDCPNVVNLMYEPERRIDVEWGKEEGAPSAFPVKLTVFCDDRFGMLKQITAVISDSKTNIRNIGARTENGQANVEIVMEIEDLKHLESIIQGVRKIPGVHDVQRLQRV